MLSKTDISILRSRSNKKKELPAVRLKSFPLYCMHSSFQETNFFLDPSEEYFGVDDRVGEIFLFFMTTFNQYENDL